MSNLVEELQNDTLDTAVGEVIRMLENIEEEQIDLAEFDLTTQSLVVDMFQKLLLLKGSLDNLEQRGVM